MAEASLSQLTSPVKDDTTSPTIQVNLVDGKTPMVSSMDVARHFQKKHKHVLDEIRRIIANLPESFNGPNFRPVEYTDPKGEKRPAFNLTRDAFTLVVMGFTGQAALAWKLRYIEAFNAMEAELAKRAKPHPLPNGWRDRHGAKPKLRGEHCTRGQAQRLEAAVDLWCELCGIRRLDALAAIRVRFDLRIFDRPPLRLHEEILNWISQQSGGRVPAPRDPSFDATVRPRPKPSHPKAPAPEAASPDAPVEVMPMPATAQKPSARLTAPAIRPPESLRELTRDAEDCQRRLGILTHSLAITSGKIARGVGSFQPGGYLEDAIRDNLNAAHAAAQTALSLLKSIRNLCHAAQ